MVAFSLLVAFLSTAAHAYVPGRVPVLVEDIDEVADYGDVSGDTSDTEADEPQCEPGELEVGSIDHGDGDCSVVSFIGITAECDVYTRAELVCVSVMFEDIEE